MKRAHIAPRLRACAVNLLLVSALTACDSSESRWSRMEAAGSTAGTNHTASRSPLATNPDSKPGSNESSSSLVLQGISFEVPPGWERVPPANPMRTAQYRLPAGKADAELAISYFGQNQGGDTPANIERWIGQFSEKSFPPQQQTVEQSGLKITTLSIAGTYNPGMMAQESPQPAWALYGAIVETGETKLFLKATGPKVALDAQHENLSRFFHSARPVKS